MSALAVGIDLGTTTSLTAICMPDGQPRVLRDGLGIGIIPSVVSVERDGRVLVGQQAKDRLVIATDTTFFSTKRFIGRDMRQEDNQWAATQYPFQIVGGENGIPMVEAHGKRYTLIDIAAMIVSYLKEVSEVATGLPVPQAVITTPANFNDVQRSSTRQAGERAGFEVLRVLNEPTAAALAYGLGQSGDERIAVYDFGGGTFDMTILELHGPVFEVLATAGDTMLGGDDLDRRILDAMIKSFQDECGLDPRANPQFLQRLHMGAERIKCQLSDWMVAGFSEQGVQIGGKTVDFRFELAREQFNEICGDLVEMSFDVCDETLRLAGCTLTSLDQIILVGGTTRVPLVRDRVAQYFQRAPLDKIQPDIVVSLGAAIQAFSLAGGPAMWPTSAGLFDEPGGESEEVTRIVDSATVAKSIEDEEGQTSASRPVTEDDIAFEESLDLPVRRSPVSLGDRQGPFGGEDERPGERLDRTLQGGPKASGGVPGPAAPPPFEPVERSAFAPAVPPPPPPARARTVVGAPVPAAVFPGPRPRPAAPTPSAPVIHAAPRVPPQAQAAAAMPPVPPAPQTAVLPPTRDSLEPPAGPVVARPRGAASTLRPPSLPPAPPGFRPPPTTTAKALAAAGLPLLEPLHGRQAPLAPAGPPPPPGSARQRTDRPPLLKEAMDTARGGAGTAPHSTPVLLDVTPLTLGVQTVGGNVESVIRRNTTVPVEQTRLFTTTQDDQTSVVVRVCQGESRKASENVVLSEVVLEDIQPGPRGFAKINVTFEIDVDGILNVSAVDTLTGKGQKIRIILFGG